MKPCILIIEDDRNILISLEFLLRHAGYTVITASDGVHGWAAAESQQPDIVVLDIMLPALDGYELCRRIRASATLRHIKILMLSARGRDAEVEKGLQLGADAYMRKPFGTRELLDTVAQLAQTEKRD